MTFVDLLATFTKRVTRPFPWLQPKPVALATPAPSALEPDQVPAVRTPLSRVEARAFISGALTSVLGRAPTAEEVKMLVAQSDLETRAWKAMWNWNFGNTTVSPTRTGIAWFRIPGEPAHRYRAFPTAQAGVTYWAKLMQRRFSEAWVVLGSGDTLAFAQALKNQGYYEAPVEDYAKGLAERYALA